MLPPGGLQRFAPEGPGLPVGNTATDAKGCLHAFESLCHGGVWSGAEHEHIVVAAAPSLVLGGAGRDREVVELETHAGRVGQMTQVGGEPIRDVDHGRRPGPPGGYPLAEGGAGPGVSLA